MPELTLKLDPNERVIGIGQDAAEASRQHWLAKDEADRASDKADVSESARDAAIAYLNPYADQAAGEAATSEGEPFSFLDGNDQVALAVRTAGGSELLPVYFDAGKVGFKQAGTGAISRNVYNRLLDLPLSVKDYGAVGDSTNGTDGTDDTAAIIAANAAASAANKPLYFPKGGYKYAPDATIDITTPWIGEGERSGVTIFCDTDSFTGQFFRAPNPESNIRHLKIKATGAVAGTGIFIGQSDSTLFVGHQTFGPHLRVEGFDRCIEANNSFHLTMDRVRASGGNEGFYCAPANQAGDNGYFTTHNHKSCAYFGNVRNVYYYPALVSVNLKMINCSIESATGGVEQSYFRNVVLAELDSVYFENVPGVPAAYIRASHMILRNVYLNGTGGITVVGNCKLSLDHVRATSSTDVLTIAASANTVEANLRHCNMPASGNDISGIDKGTITNSSINGTTYDFKVLGSVIFDAVTTSALTANAYQKTQQNKAHAPIVRNSAATATRTDLTNSSATNVFTFSLSNSTGGALTVPYQVLVYEAGVTRQSEAGTLHIVAHRAGGATPSVGIVKQGGAQSISSGTLTVTPGISANSSGVVTVTINASSSLSSPSVQFYPAPVAQVGAFTDLVQS